MLFDETYLYGSQYYRPPNPPADQHDWHLTRIRNELNFNAVKFRLQWNWIERVRGELYLDEVEAMLRRCDELGQGVLIEINLESAPYWLEEKHPEARYVNARGQAMELGPYDSTQGGGYPGLCFHHESVREEMRRYLKLLITALRSYKCILAYDCWNEPHLEPVWQCNFWGDTGDKLYCYCEESRRAFRCWLEDKYGDIETFNNTWARAYNSFDQINPPNRNGGYADWLDFMRFWFDSLADHMRFRYEVIKEADPDRMVLSHSGAVPPFLARASACIHNWKLAAEVDGWGTSFAPKAPDWRLADMSGVLDATRSAARGKPWWVAEMSGGCLYSRGFNKKMPYTRPKDVRSWNWLSVACGAKGICYWCYLTESTGPEAGGFGLVPFSGELSERAREASVQSTLLQSLHPVIRDHEPVPQVSVLYDPDNSTLLWAMEETDQLYGDSFSGYCQALFECDVFAHYLTYDTIDDIREKVLIVPMCLTLRADVAEKIRKFVEEGGVLICDARMGLFDQRGFLQPILPSFGLHEAAGLREEESYCSDPSFRPARNERWPDEVYCGPVLTLNEPVQDTMTTAEFLSPLRLEGAEATGGWNGLVTSAHHRYGRGEVWYFGTYAGVAIRRGDKGALRAVKALISRYTEPEVKGEALRPRLVKGDGRTLLCVFNDDPYATHSDRIALPVPFTSAVSLFDGKKADVKDGILSLTVEGDDVAVFELF
ncbi:MAG: beta-galactosidase [Clostridia bacterium]|nr:beta-galactosidase [Clostridia bacterium]